LPNKERGTEKKKRTKSAAVGRLDHGLARKREKNG